jgi:hypothetical protein
MTTPFDKTDIYLLDSASGAQNHYFAPPFCNANSNHYLSQCGELIAFSRLWITQFLLSVNSNIVKYFQKIYKTVNIYAYIPFGSFYE